MIYGITPNGLNAKDFAILKRELLDSWKQSFGTIDEAPDGVFGQLADSLSSAHSDVWKMIQDYYLGMSPSTATGSQLSRLLTLQGMTPLGATYGSVDVLCGSTLPTLTLPATASEVSHTTSNKSFALADELVISKANVNRFEFKVDTGVVEGNVVGFTIQTQYTTDVVPVKVTTTLGETPESVAERLVTRAWDIGAQIDISEAKISETDSDTVVVTTFSPFRTIAVGELIGGSFGTLPKLYRTGHFVAKDIGFMVTPPHTVTSITSGLITGWDSVDNLVSGVSGADAENDDDLRRRLSQYKQYGSTGSRLAIEGKMWQNITNLSNVRISSNNSSETDVYGRPPHSMHCIVEGGSEEEVAQVIAENVPAGIATFGEVTVDVDVSWQSEAFKVNFSRVKQLYGHIRVTINDLNQEEILQSNAEQLIKDSLYAELTKVSVLGADIITQKYVGAVYRATSGLENITVEVGVTGHPDTDVSVPVGNPWEYTVDTYASGWQSEKVDVAPSDRVEWRDAYSRIIVKGVNQ